MPAASLAAEEALAGALTVRGGSGLLPSPAELAAELSISLSTVSRALVGLQARGALEVYGPQRSRRYRVLGPAGEPRATIPAPASAGPTDRGCCVSSEQLSAAVSAAVSEALSRALSPLLEELVRVRAEMASLRESVNESVNRSRVRDESVKVSPELTDSSDSACISEGRVGQRVGQSSGSAVENSEESSAESVASRSKADRVGQCPIESVNDRPTGEISPAFPRVESVNESVGAEGNSAENSSSRSRVGRESVNGAVAGVGAELALSGSGSYSSPLIPELVSEQEKNLPPLTPPPRRVSQRKLDELRGLDLAAQHCWWLYQRSLLLVRRLQKRWHGPAAPHRSWRPQEFAPARRGMLVQAVRDHGHEVAALACRNLALIPHYLGANDRKTEYLRLDLAVRSKAIERVAADPALPIEAGLPELAAVGLEAVLAVARVCGYPVVDELRWLDIDDPAVRSMLGCPDPERADRSDWQDVRRRRDAELARRRATALVEVCASVEAVAGSGVVVHQSDMEGQLWG